VNNPKEQTRGYMKKTILLSAKQSGGKSSIAKIIKERLNSIGVNVKIVKYADTIYSIHNVILFFMRLFGIRYKNNKNGPLLQFIGHSIGRRFFGKNIWVNIAKIKSFIYSKNNIVIMEDCRYKNEFEAFPDALKIRLEADKEIRKARCENWRENDTHQSEIDLDDWVDRFDLVYETDKNKSADEIAEEIIFYLLNS